MYFKLDGKFDLQLARLFNLDRLAAGATLGTDLLDGCDDVHALGDGAEDHVLAVQPGGFGGTQEELGAVGARASVSHREDTSAGVLEVEVFVGELFAVDGFATSAVLAGEVTTLAHKAGDDAVERRTSIAETLLAGAQGSEVFCGFRDNVSAQGHFNAASGGTANGNIKVADRVGHSCVISIK
jgi:hypothetical protein